ncbi:MAG: hypothetical protein SFV51_06825 [Bryobacteraceae bacterium]|nr:hypothetical protein [Bryobacteraceae bacterium]
MIRIFSLALFASSLLFSQPAAETLVFRAALSGSGGSAPATVWLHLLRDEGGQIVSGSIDTQIRGVIPIGSTAAFYRADVLAFDYGEVRTAVGGPLRQLQIRAEDEDAVTRLRAMVEAPASHVLFVQFPEGDMQGGLERAETAVAMGEFSGEAGLGRLNGAVAVTGLRSARGGSVTFVVSLQARGIQVNSSGVTLHRGAEGETGAALLTVDSPIVSLLGLPATARITAEITEATQAALDGLFGNPAGWYVMLRDSGIRVQLRATDRKVFRAALTPTGAVVSLAAAENTAFGLVTLYTQNGGGTAAHVVFDVNLRLPQRGDFCGAHLRRNEGKATLASTTNRVCDGFSFPEGVGNLFRGANVFGESAGEAPGSFDPAAHYLTLDSVENQRIVEALSGPLAAQ